MGSPAKKTFSRSSLAPPKVRLLKQRERWGTVVTGANMSMFFRLARIMSSSSDQLVSWRSLKLGLIRSCPFSNLYQCLLTSLGIESVCSLHERILRGLRSQVLNQSSDGGNIQVVNQSSGGRKNSVFDQPSGGKNISAMKKGSSRCLKVGGTKQCLILPKATWPRLLKSS